MRVASTRPASSIWISLGDRQHKIKHARSVSITPVVFGIRRPLAEELGFTEKDKTIKLHLQPLFLSLALVLLYYTVLNVASKLSVKTNNRASGFQTVIKLSRKRNWKIDTSM